MKKKPKMIISSTIILSTIGFFAINTSHAEIPNNNATEVQSTHVNRPPKLELNDEWSQSSQQDSFLFFDENEYSGWLNYIPLLIDATPTIFPEQSDISTVPPTTATEDLTWTDKKQKQISNWVDRTANKMDGWFGDTDPKHPATASLRVLFDNQWNKYDGYDFSPRIRGKIKLPALEKRLSLVFGDDSLDDELANNIAITNAHASNDPNKKIDGKQIREDNSSIALRWSQLSKHLPFDIDADLGIRSGDDIYARLKAQKDWTLEHDFTFHAEQIYRYGIQSENYLRTNLELTHARPNQPFVSNQFYLTYADEQDDDLTWDNRTYRQHQFFKGNRFNYGVYTGGFYNKNNLRLNSWGPFVSWRQPLWREWFYVQGDLNYFNDHREDQSHHSSVLVRLEALF